MKSFFVLILTLISCCLPELVYAQSAQRFFQNIRLPSSQVVLEHEIITTPIVATTNYIKTTYAGPTSAAALVLSSFTHQPDVPRNITITPTGTTGDVESCVITVAGTDILGKAISEDLTFAANASTIQTGNKAFKTVSSVTWPANCESGGFGATWIIGVGSKLGVKRCTINAGALDHGVFNGATEATQGTFASSATVASLNTYTPNGTMDASKNVEVYYSQNFACY